ncbi:MAG TPA: hypothetical protein VJ860_17185 [Polyangia bacterium]|nr:hypothetical protein [Polyangia bacterium]
MGGGEDSGGLTPEPPVSFWSACSGTIIAPFPKRTSVRTHAGPHEICVQPSQEKRSCGEPGTLRQVYFYEGWSLTVRCDR